LVRDQARMRDREQLPRLHRMPPARKLVLHTFSHDGELPAKSGRHMLLAVWTSADTRNAFYQCIEVDFG
jgi:hypothetical protein